MIKLQSEIVLTGEGYQSSPRLLKLVKRTDHVAMYSRADMNKSPNEPYCYEVFKVPSHKKGYTWQNGKVEEDDREYYPGASAFGRSAWSIKSLSSAENKYQNLLRDKSIKDEEDKLMEDCQNSSNMELFTINDYATKHSLTYIDARKWVLENCVPVSKRSSGRGKPSVLYKMKES